MDGDNNPNDPQNRNHPFHICYHFNNFSEYALNLHLYWKTVIYGSYVVRVTPRPYDQIILCKMATWLYLYTGHVHQKKIIKKLVSGSEQRVNKFSSAQTSAL